MQKKPAPFFTLLLWLLSSPLLAINYRAGDAITIDSNLNSDSYIACKHLTVNATVNGDLIAAAQTITINDQVTGDFSAAGETVILNGNAGDDVRIFARTFTLSGLVKGDVIVFSGDVTIAGGSVIEGDLVVFSGNVQQNGTVKGNVIIKGEKIILSGAINGNARIKGRELEATGIVQGVSSFAGEKIMIGDEAQFQGKVTYWQQSGRLEEDKSKFQGGLYYDETLGKDMQEEESKKWLGGLGFILWHLIYGALLIVLLQLLFYGWFARAGKVSGVTPFKSLGLGILYFIIAPFIIAFLFLILVGIPIGILLFFLYIFTLVSGIIISSLVTAHFINDRYHRNWSKVMVSGVAMLVLLALNLLLLIPVLGFLVDVFLVAVTFGALLLSLKKPSSYQETTPVAQ